VSASRVGATPWWVDGDMRRNYHPAHAAHCAGSDIVWWTPREDCDAHAPPCASGALALALNHSTHLVRCGERGDSFRYFSRHDVMRCFDALAPSPHEPFRMLLVGTSMLGFVWKSFRLDDAVASEWHATQHDRTKRCASSRASPPTQQYSASFTPHAIDYHRWNFVAPSSTLRTDASSSYGILPADVVAHNAACHGPSAPRLIVAGAAELYRRSSNLSRAPDRTRSPPSASRPPSRSPLRGAPAAPYSVVVVAVGAWDVQWGSSADAFESALRRGLARFARAWPTARLLVVSQTPEGRGLTTSYRARRGASLCGSAAGPPTAGGVPPPPSHLPSHQRTRWTRLNDMVIALNARMRRVAADANATYVDAHQLVMSHPNVRDPELWESCARRPASWHFNELSQLRQLTSGRAPSSGGAGGRGELSRAIALRILNEVCP
jgi:hypothetical protein